MNCKQIGIISGPQFDKLIDISRRVYSIEGLSPTIHTSGGGQQEPKVLIMDRVRKLTPKECWRLMGFTDADFRKAEAVNSNAQLYKQAGNSIVVPVLEGILRNLLEDDYDIPKTRTDLQTPRFADESEDPA